MQISIICCFAKLSKTEFLGSNFFQYLKKNCSPMNQLIFAWTSKIKFKILVARVKNSSISLRFVQENFSTVKYVF